MAEPARTILETIEARCCVAGGGPAGVVLAYLLARQGVETVLLESHRDFDRDFRGDTLHPGVLEILADLGLADRLLALPHSKIRRGVFRTPQGNFELMSLDGLPSPYPYIALIRQDAFLEFLAREAGRFPTFRRRMGANVKELIEGGGAVRGVRAQAHDGWIEVRADLTVAADGRFSRVRDLAGLTPEKNAAPIDVLWFRLPHTPADSAAESVGASVKGGHILVRFDRGDHWQLGYLIPKGGYHALRDRGIDAFRASVADLLPELADRVGELRDWSQVTPLVIESSRLPLWHGPGLLLIGDAAHVMSPIGGVGINYAIQDAVEAANLLAEPLRERRLTDRDLDAVQRRRWWPTVAIQWFQGRLQDRLLDATAGPDAVFRPPAFLRWRPLRRLAARFLAYGLRRVRVHLRHDLAAPP